MIKLITLTCVCMALAIQARAQQLEFSKAAVTDPAELARTMPALVRQVITTYKTGDRATYLDNLFRLQIIAGDYAGANASIKSLRDLLKATDPLYASVTYTQYEIFSNAKLTQAAKNISCASDRSKEFCAELNGHLCDPFLMGA